MTSRFFAYSHIALCTHIDDVEHHVGNLSGDAEIADEVFPILGRVLAGVRGVEFE